MHMIAMRLIPASASTSCPDEPSTLLMRQSVPDDSIEHIWADAREDAIDIVFFVLVPHEAEALLTARAVCLRALERETKFSRWQLANTG